MNYTADLVIYSNQKLRAFGEHLKFGFTKNPANRYTKEQLVSDELKVIVEGAKKDMPLLERSLHETLPIGPKEGQAFYIQKRIDKFLKLPSIQRIIYEISTIIAI